MSFFNQIKIFCNCVKFHVDFAEFVFHKFEILVSKGAIQLSHSEPNNLEEIPNIAFKIVVTGSISGKISQYRNVYCMIRSTDIHA